MRQKQPLTFIDLFSGCGGMSVGMRTAGLTPVLAIDNCSDALETFRLNDPGVTALNLDLGSCDPSKDLAIRETPTVIVGGPPCQGFSISGKRNPDDPRNRLYLSFVRFVRHFLPPIFVMENVPNMASMGGGKILGSVIEEFESLGYEVTYRIMLASDYGVPQNRRRLIVVGSRLEGPFEFPLPTTPKDEDKVTTSQAISDLPEHSVRDGADYPHLANSRFQVEMRGASRGIWNHQITNHSSDTVSTIALVPDGGNYKNLPEHLRDTRKVNIAWTRYSSNRPSLTIDTGHRHHFHYKFNRIPTVRESARLQSFPDDFIFAGSKTSQYRQVGNAVPPKLAAAIGSAICVAIHASEARAIA